MKRGLLAILFSGVVLAATARAASSSDPTLTQANEAYQHGDYARAATQFQQLIDKGVVTADMYFNLGTAELKAGQRGAAILAFERALRLDPADGDAAFNLAEAQKGNIDKIVGTSEEEPLLERLGARIPVGTLGLVFLVTWLAGNLALMARWYVGQRLAWLGLLGSIALSVSLVTGAFFALGAWDRSHSPYAIVVSPSAAVREGPAGDFKSAFEIHEGLKVRIVRQDQGFLRVRLPNGIEGWVSEKDAPII
jgi:tetratricopeptide (TPR) repeat protein